MRANVVGLAIALAAIASAMPDPTWVTDRGAYERMTREWFITGCGDYHCFRVLVPWMLRLLPGPEWLEWKAYAVVCEIAAAVLMARWVTVLGISRRVALMVLWATGLGSGSLYAVFDPYSSDPLMHVLGPLLPLLAHRARMGLAGVTAAVGTLAKEFAVVPLYVVAALRAQQRRWPEARRAAMAAGLGTLVWVAWQAFLRLAFDYETGPTRSANLLSGGFIVFWLTHMGPRLIVESIAGVFAGFWLLWMAGLIWGGPTIRQLTLSALPAMLLFCYVQQPDRALWNFAFVVMPAVAVVLQHVGPLLAWTLVAAQGAANLRIGAQLEFAPPARFAFVLAAVLAMIAMWQVAALKRAHMTAELTS